MGKKRSRSAWQRSRKKRVPVVKAVPSSVGGTSARPPNPSQPSDSQVLARLAENVWRLGIRAQRDDSGSWAKPILERLNEDLRDLGIEIIDRTGTPYRDGETMETLHSDAPADWTGGLVVTEVVCPTIRIGGAIVERGKVVVGPEADNTRGVNDNAG